MIYSATNRGSGANGHVPASEYAAIRKSGGRKLQDPAKVGPGMINPFTWNREHQLALLVAALIGAALATVLGYIVYAVGWGEGALPFENWIWQPLRGAIWWAVFGAVIGGAMIFVQNLMRVPVNSAGSRTTLIRSSRPNEDSPQERLQERSPTPPRLRL
jgi:hypothetical protein